MILASIWTVLAAGYGGGGSGGGGGSSAWYWIVVAVVAIVVIGLIGWGVSRYRARRSAGRSDRTDLGTTDRAA